MNDLLYCYPDSDVLKNKLGIINQEKLHEVERKLTAIRINDLIRKPYRGRFDLDHLRGIHFYIFQDLYTWAGELRKVDIAKGNMFCRAMFLENQADVVFSGIRNDGFLEGLDYDQFVKRLAYHFSEINALHLFREGNGRSQREFIRELASERNRFIIPLFSSGYKAFLLRAPGCVESFIPGRGFGPLPGNRILAFPLL